MVNSFCRVGRHMQYATLECPEAIQWKKYNEMKEKRPCRDSWCLKTAEVYKKNQHATLPSLSHKKVLHLLEIEIGRGFR